MKNLEIPQIRHLKWAIFSCLVCGAWPLQTRRSLPFLVYRIFSWLIAFNCILNIVATLTNLIEVCLNEFDIILVTNICTSITLYFIGLYRFVNVKTKSALILINEILTKENEIIKSEDEDIIKIYNDNVRKNIKVNKLYYVSQIMDSCTYLFIICPIFVPKVVYIDPRTNETYWEKPLPVKPWFPFDEHKHHITAYVSADVACLICLLCNYGTDVMFYSFITYVLGQIDILKHIFRNFERYSEKVGKQLGCDLERADFVTFQLCIIEHRRIIKYINNFNNSMRNAMLFDFLQNSFQLSMLSVLIMKETIFLIRAIAGAYALIMLLRLGLFYWYANEIIIQSWSVSDTFLQIDWFNKSKRFKSLMVIFIMRCNKQTGIQIGPLTVMSWDIFFGIIKGAYSFIMFVLQR